MTNSLRPRKNQAGIKITIVVVLILAFTLYYLLMAKNSDLHYDGALYAQGYISLLKYGTYVDSLYNQNPEKLPFTIYPQGRFSQYFLNLPIIQFLGVNNFSLQINNLLFLFLSALLVYCLVNRITGSYFLSLLSLVLFFTFPGVSPSSFLASAGIGSLYPDTARVPSLALGGLGELPASFYLMLTVFVLLKSFEKERYFLLLGVVLFLAFEAKFYFILVFPVLLALLFILWKFEHAVRSKNILTFVIGFLLPLIVLNLTFVWMYGWKAVFQYHAEFWRLTWIHQYGFDKVGWFENIRRGIAYLSLGYGTLLGFYVPLLAGYGAAILAICANIDFSQRRLRLDNHQITILHLFTLLVIYVIWWYHLSTVAQWYRKIFPVLILNIPLYILSFQYLRKRFSISLGQKVLVTILGIVVLVPMTTTQVHHFISTFELKTEEDQALKDRKEMVQIISNLPEGEKVFGVWWWQAPRLSLFSGRIFLDIEKHPEFKQGYLVFDHEALRIGHKKVKDTLSRYDVELVKRNEHYELYRWKTKH